MLTEIPRSSFKNNVYSSESTYFVTPPIIVTSSLAGFPRNFNFLAKLNVTKESVLPESQRTFVVLNLPLGFPAVSHCAGDNVPFPGLDAVS